MLLEALIEKPVSRLVVASSMSIYGEGLYRDADGNLLPGADRDREQLRARDWDPRDAQGRPLTPVPTPETKPPVLSSVYALSSASEGVSNLYNWLMEFRGLVETAVAAGRAS